jgi:mono/diheme cytochrome c family protein
VAEAKPPEGTHAGASDAATLPVPEGATAEMVVLGERIYHGQVGGATCTGCHGSDATGSPLGPNLTTNRWFWSDGTNAGIAATIRVGVMHPKNYRAPMPPMGGAQLTAEQVSAVADYVWALSQPAAAATGARVPAELAIPGEKVFPESITSAADGRMFIGSIVKREIFAVKPGEAAARPWIDADGNTALGVYGVFPIGADGKSGAISAVTLNRPIQAPDGMRSFGKEGMLLVESGGKGRLSLLEVQGSTGQVTTLKEGFPEGPVSVAVVGTSAYVLEGQLDALFGPAQPNRALKPFHATA